MATDILPNIMHKYPMLPQKLHTTDNNFDQFNRHMPRWGFITMGLWCRQREGNGGVLPALEGRSISPSRCEPPTGGRVEARRAVAVSGHAWDDGAPGRTRGQDVLITGVA
jgi:hypothetical protein